MTGARDPLPDFGALCEDACIKLWGKPDKRDGNQLRWNGADAYSARTFSLANPVWYDHGEGRGGGLLDLVAYEQRRPKEKLTGKAFFDAWRAAYAMGIVPDPPPDKPNGHGGGGSILATYDYHDEGGVRLFQVVRFDTPNPKERFKQRRPDGNGGWIWNTNGVRTHLLYRLPELIEAVKAGQRHSIGPIEVDQAEQGFRSFRDRDICGLRRVGGRLADGSQGAR